MVKIDAISFGEPEVRNSKLVIPLEVSYGYNNSVTVYLTEEKLQSLKESTDEAIETLQEVSS